MRAEGSISACGVLFPNTKPLPVSYGCVLYFFCICEGSPDCILQSSLPVSERRLTLSRQNSHEILDQRLHPAHEFEGTGIGLALVRKSVERMEGFAGVESDPGNGSRFWIQLKAAHEIGQSNPPGGR